MIHSSERKFHRSYNRSLRALVIALVAMSSRCQSPESNTRFSPNFSISGFERVLPGDNLHEVVALLGLPIQTFVMPWDMGKRPTSLLDGQRTRSVDWSEVDSSASNSHVLLMLMYSEQINPRKDYMHCAIRIRSGRVHDKTIHLITE